MTVAAAAGVCFDARALAQAHPMSEAADRYLRQCAERERRRQPVSELADWAATALVVGYCVRRIEEQRKRDGQGSRRQQRSRAGDAFDDRRRVDEGRAGEGRPGPGGIDLERVGVLTQTLRTGDASSVSLLPAAVTVAALDRIIATEIDKRREHLREQLDDPAWAELEDFIAWWVVHGYALRAGEVPHE